MVLAISSTLTKGLNVLGPGRITRSTGSSGSDSSSLARSSPSTTRSSLVTTQAFHPTVITRLRTSPTASSSAHVGTSRRTTSTSRGRSAFDPSVGSPAPPIDPGPEVEHLGEPHALESGRRIQATSWVLVDGRSGFVVGAQKLVPTLEAAHELIYQHSLKLENARAIAAYGQNSSVGKILEIHQELPGRIHIVLILETVGF